MDGIYDTMTCGGSHLGFPIGIKNRGPSNDHSRAVWFQLSKWFQRSVIYQYLYGHICFCKCKLFPFFPRFVIVTYYLRVFNKCDNGSRRVFVRPVKIKMVD